MHSIRQPTLLARLTTRTARSRSANVVSTYQQQRYQSNSSHPLAGVDQFNSRSQPLAGTSKPSNNDTPRSAAAPPTELLTVLEETIKTHGPLPVPRYMTLCLNHPTLGYYTTRTVFGKEGDFVTSPEISQVFGELLGIWFVTQWLAQGAPKKVRVVELGPGRGTLLADVLRTFKSLPSASSPPVTSIHLIEQSEQLQSVQKEALRRSGFGETPVSWWRNLEEVPQTSDEFTIAIAHEFFDALPIHIFERTAKGWREVLVDINDPKKSSVIVSSEKREPLRLVLSPTPTPASALYSSLAQAVERDIPTTPTIHGTKPLSLNFDTTQPLQSSTTSSFSPSASTTTASSATEDLYAPSSSSSSPESINLTSQRFARLPQGSRLEISPSSYEIARSFSKLISGGIVSSSSSSNGVGGAGLIVDYGDSKAFARSWRGFRKHNVVDPLSEPGHTDLTANVDFSYIKEAMSEFATPHGPITQSHFLTSLGLAPRIASLIRSAPSEERRKDLESSGKRLIDRLGMGGQYKVLGVTPLVSKEGGGKSGKGDCFPFDLEGI